MTLQELRQAPHLSASGISEFIECGLSYKFSHIDKLQPESYPDTLAFGSVIHKVLENYHQLMMAGTIMDIEEIQAVWEKHWLITTTNRADLMYSEGKNFETLLNEGKQLLAAYVEKRPEDKDCIILALEEPFSFMIEGIEVPIIGGVDMILEDSNGAIIIVDFKTAGRAYSPTDVDQNFQLSVYHMAAKRNGYADREIILRLDVLEKKKTPDFKQYYTTRSEKDEKRAIRKIKAVHEAIQKQAFVPNDTSWRCKNCGYGQACQAWFLQEGHHEN